MKPLQLMIGVGLVVALAACNQARPPTAADTEKDADTLPRSNTRIDAQPPTRRPPMVESAAANFDLGGIAAMHKYAVAPFGTMPSVDRERYAEIDSHGVTTVTSQPVSTFSIDVDTGSYSNVRRMLQEGRLPVRDAVRIEELINYFAYQDPRPSGRDVPLRVTTTMAPTPWNADTRLLRIALRAWDVPQQDLPRSNLVFLIDVSGSMNSPDKLPLLKRSIKLLTRRMDADDRISLVVYAGAAGVVLEPTAGDQQATIEAALDQLRAGGSTHGSAGIRLAYAKARESLVEGGINRVILATDGDFNVGTVDQRALIDLIERERAAGIALTTLGFGRGNLNDQLMEQLADHGNGNYAYIDNLLEAQKVLVEQMGGTLLTVAKDVKIQVEFNPARVAEYRLLGYENRMLRREDFNNDRIDAGELGAGHRVVALYELRLAGAGGGLIDPLRYTVPAQGEVAERGDEYAFVKLRYKQPDARDSQLLSVAVTDAVSWENLADSDDDFRFSAAVAAFGQHLRGATYLGDFGYADILSLARSSRGTDHHGYRADFLRLVGLAQSLDRRPVDKVAGNAGNG